MKKYKIADIVIELDSDIDLIDHNLDMFEWKEPEKAQFYWTIKDCDGPVIPKSIKWIEFSGFSVGRYQDKVYVSYPLEHIYKIRWIIYEDNFSKATYYYNERSLASLTQEQKTELSKYLFAFYRESFFLGVLYRDGISIHSSSLIYRRKGIVFSALSQTGKTTHTNMWKQKYETPILDGDVTICRCLEDGNYIYGLPWCGTSNMYLNQKAELEAVVFLKQGPRNIVSRMNVYEAFQQLFARGFTPLWDSELMRQRVEVSERVIKRIPQIYLLECLPEMEAVEVVKQAIDESWK